MSDVDWEAKYKENSAPWERKQLSPSVDLVMRQCEQGSKIVIPGCGRSHEPLYFAQNGLAITGLDIAPSAIEFQKTAFADSGHAGNFLVADILEWQPEIPVDIIYEQTCLCAISPGLRLAYEVQIHRWLEPHGLLVANFLQTTSETGPPFHCSIDGMKRLFAPDRWTWEEGVPLRVNHELEMYEYSYSLRRI